MGKRKQKEKRKKKSNNICAKTLSPLMRALLDLLLKRHHWDIFEFKKKEKIKKRD